MARRTFLTQRCESLRDLLGLLRFHFSQLAPLLLLRGAPFRYFVDVLPQSLLSFERLLEGGEHRLDTFFLGLHFVLGGF